MFCATFIYLFILSNGAASVNYEGYKVYEVRARNSQQMQILDFLYSTEMFDFWSRNNMNNEVATIMVKPSIDNAFNNIMRMYGFEYRPLIKDVETTIEATIYRRMNKMQDVIPSGQISFTEYNRYDTIKNYLLSLSNTIETVTLLNIGQSSEGRDLLGVKISSGREGNPAILVDAGFHAREWIGPATALYLIKQLSENITNFPMLEKIDWYIFPLMNPDGYEYTHTTDRLWRKTRSRGEDCIGVDPNRNFGFHWLEKGANNEECSGIYAGPFAYSEPEVALFAQFAATHKNKIKLYLTLHSFGKFILYPWGYAKHAYPKDAEELHFLAEIAKNAIQSTSGTKYTIGSSADLLGAAAGGSDDWMKGVAGVKYSYTIELPGGGISGFDAPPKYIWPIVKETFPAFKAFANYIKFKKFDDI